MNHVKLAHYHKAGNMALGGRGKVYINGHEVKGVLDFKHNLLEVNEVATVTMTIAVSTFVYAPDEAPAIQMRD